LRYVVGIPLEEVRRAHLAAKRRLIEEVAARQQIRLNESRLTIGFARRATTYKRVDFLSLIRRA
jgi:starch phosphorylase